MLKMDLKHKQARSECASSETRREVVLFGLDGLKLFVNLKASFILNVALSEELKELNHKIDSLRAIGWEQE